MKEVNNLAEFKQLIESGAVVIVDFFATWCGPCVAISPFFKQLAEENGSDKLVFIKVDVDKANEIAQFAGIKAMPTFKAYKNGQQIKEIVGANRNALQALVAENK